MDLNNPWYEFAHRVRRGESSKDELIELLRRNYPIPTEAQPFIADLLEGKRKFKKRGTKSKLDSIEQKALMASMLFHTEEYLMTQDPVSLDCIAYPDEGQLREYLAIQAKTFKTNGGSPREAAKEYVASYFSISVRSLEHHLSPDRERDYWR